MERSPRYGLIKRMQAGVPRGAPFGLEALRELGVSASQAARYAERGWLVRLGQGVYGFPGDAFGAHGGVKLLQEMAPGLHVGGKSALALQGVRHNLAGQSTLVLWGNARFVLPEWFTSRFPARYVAASLFDQPADRLAKLTLTTPPGVTAGLLVSTPERAAFEMLYEVGTHEGLEEARNVFEGLRNLRKDVVGRLLSSCTSVKTVRLFLTWAEETGLLEVGSFRKQFKARIGSDRRWMRRLKDGTLLVLKSHG